MKKLNEIIKELEKKSEEIKGDDPDSAGRIKEVAGKLKSKTSGESEEHRDSIIEHLRENIYHFETRHPVIGELLERAVNQLSGMGI